MFYIMVTVRVTNSIYIIIAQISIIVAQQQRGTFLTSNVHCVSSHFLTLNKIFRRGGVMIVNKYSTYCHIISLKKSLVCVMNSKN